MSRTGVKPAVRG